MSARGPPSCDGRGLPALSHCVAVRGLRGLLPWTASDLAWGTPGRRGCHPLCVRLSGGSVVAVRSRCFVSARDASIRVREWTCEGVNGHAVGIRFVSVQSHASRCSLLLRRDTSWCVQTGQRERTKVTTSTLRRDALTIPGTGPAPATKRKRPAPSRHCTHPCRRRSKMRPTRRSKTRPPGCRLLSLSDLVS